MKRDMISNKKTSSLDHLSKDVSKKIVADKPDLGTRHITVTVSGPEEEVYRYLKRGDSQISNPQVIESLTNEQSRELKTMLKTIKCQFTTNDKTLREVKISMLEYIAKKSKKGFPITNKAFAENIQNWKIVFDSTGGNKNKLTKYCKWLQQNEFVKIVRTGKVNYYTMQDDFYE